MAEKKIKKAVKPKAKKTVAPKKVVKPKKETVSKDKEAKIKAQEEANNSARVEARWARIKELEQKPVEEPKTTLEAIKRASDKRARLAGLLMQKKAFGNRAQGVEELKAEIEELNKVIEELKIAKVAEDAKGNNG